MLLSDKLQEIFNISYSHATVACKRKKEIEDLPISFVQRLEEYGVVFISPAFDPHDGTWEHKDHLEFLLIKHPFDVQFEDLPISFVQRLEEYGVGLPCYGDLKVPHDFALKVVSLGYLPCV